MSNKNALGQGQRGHQTRSALFALLDPSPAQQVRLRPLPPATTLHEVGQKGSISIKRVHQIIFLHHNYNCYYYIEMHMLGRPPAIIELRL